MTCQHEVIQTYYLEDTGAPAGLWACTECKTKFVPITELAAGRSSEMNEDQLQIYHDAKPHRDDLRAVIDSLNQENAALRAKVEEQGEQGMVLVSEKCTKAVCTALRLGSKVDVPSDQLCEIRWAAALVAAMGDADPYAATRMAISAQWLK